VNRELFRLIFEGAYGTLGEAVVAAKRVVASRDLRRSWIFFGDPAMRLSSTPLPDIARSPDSPPPVTILPRDPNDVQELTVTVSGNGSVTVLPAGITCPLGTCSANFSSGAAIQLVAASENGSTFIGWSGACSGGTAICSLTLSAAASVTATFALGQRAELTTPAPGSTLTASTVAFQWTGGTASHYWLHVGTAIGGRDLFNQDRGTSLSATVAGLTSGSAIYVRLWSLLGESWLYNDYAYTGAAAALARAELTTPAPESTLTASTVQFQWTGGTASQYWLHVGTTFGGNDLYNQGRGVLAATVSGLPADGSTVYVRLWSLVGNDWLWNDYTYEASITAQTTARAQLTTPSPGSTLTASTVQFQWTGGTGVSQYWLTLGTTAAGNDLYSQNQGTSLSRTVTGLPANGSTVHVRLWSTIEGAWQFNDYTYTATTIGQTTAPAQMTMPAPGSTLAASTVQFQWTGGTGASQYWLSVGTTAGGTQLFDQDRGTSLNATITGLPADASTLYVRLGSLINGTWQNNDYTYTATTSSNATAQMTTPAPGSTLAASTVQFQWTGGTGVSQYWLYVGTTAGGKDLYNRNQGTSLNATVIGLPAGGGPVYVRLWSLVGSDWLSNDYTYTATTQSSTPAQMTTPAPGSTLTASTVQFQWTGGTGVSQYWLHVGTMAGEKDLYNQNQGTNLSASVTGLPTNGSTVYVRLWSYADGTWQYNDYTYIAAH
jgi:serine protease